MGLAQQVGEGHCRCHPLVETILSPMWPDQPPWNPDRVAKSRRATCIGESPNFDLGTMLMKKTLCQLDGLPLSATQFQSFKHDNYTPAVKTCVLFRGNLDRLRRAWIHVSVRAVLLFAGKIADVLPY